MIKLGKMNYVIVVLSVLLVLALGYILVDRYIEGQRERLNTVYQQGFDAGAQRANQLIMNQVLSDLNSLGATAITVPTTGNETVTIPLIAQTTIIQALNRDGYFAFNAIQNGETVEVKLIMPSACD